MNNIVVFGNNTFKIVNDTWCEYTTNSCFKYATLYEDSSIVLLEDTSRNVSLRLYKDGSLVEISVNNSPYDKLYVSGYLSHSDIKLARNVEEVIKYKGNVPIAIVSQATPNMSAMTKLSFANHEAYARKHGYTYVCYYDTLVDFTYVTWNKVYVLQEQLKKYKYVMWIDADAIFTNMNVKLEGVLQKAKHKHLHVCNDIGGWRLNTGVMIWEQCKWTQDLLDQWTSMKKIPHNQGAEQQQIINLLKNVDNHCNHWHIHDQKVFNTHPKVHTMGDFVLHMMGMSGQERINTFKHWNKQLNVQSA